MQIAILRVAERRAMQAFIVRFSRGGFLGRAAMSAVAARAAVIRYPPR